MKTNLQLLIERVREIDWYAAKFLEDNCSKIEDDCSFIWELFDWEATPQGYDYWYDLSKKLGEQ